MPGLLNRPPVCEPGDPGPTLSDLRSSGDDGDVHSRSRRGLELLGSRHLPSAGAYENFATVTADSERPDDTDVIDNDPSHYYGIVSAPLDHQVHQRGRRRPHNRPRRPGAEDRQRRCCGPMWSPTRATLRSLGWAVTDDIGTPSDPSDDSPAGCPRIVLFPGSSATCHLPGTVEEGQYANIGTVTGTDIVGNPIPSDTDPSHYIGVTPRDRRSRRRRMARTPISPRPLRPVPGHR